MPTAYWLLSFLLFSQPGQLQEPIPRFGSPLDSRQTLSVHVADEDGGALLGAVRCELLRGGMVWAEAYSDMQGRCFFPNLNADTYLVRVSADGYKTQESFVHMNGDIPSSASIRMTPLPGRALPPPTTGGDGTTVSVRELSVPKKAQKEFTKARQLYHRGDYKGAVKHVRKGLKVDPTFAPAHNQLGLAYWALGRLTEAEEAFNTAVKFDPELFPAYLNLGELLGRRKQYKRASQMLVQAHRIRPQRAEPYFVAARIHYLSGHLERAEKACLDALQLDHTRVPAVHLLLANIYERREDLDKVVENLEAYLKKAPGSNKAEQLQATLKKLREQQAKRLAP